VRRHPKAPVNVAGISVATSSGTDFTALNAIWQRSSGLSLGKITLRARRELVATHFLISPILEIADCKDL
jgi:hypothetical protein